MTTKQHTFVLYAPRRVRRALARKDMASLPPEWKQHINSLILQGASVTAVPMNLHLKEVRHG